MNKMITKVEGFIVNEVNYGESSKVINVLTKDFGLLGIMCKGVKSMKSRLRALIFIKRKENFLY